jgi:hypothetical protein
MQIHQPGLVRFAETELLWPGVAAAKGTAARGALKVPKLPAPQLDGRLDEPCWQQAVVLPPGPPDQPVQPRIRLGCDETRCFIGASFPSTAESCFQPATTAADAAGAVDGVKNGRYAFHTNLEPNPWWQVDLGTRQALGKIVVFNRLDYGPGLHNADILVILVSADGKTWTQCYDNRGTAFGGVTDGKPLVVDFTTQRPAGTTEVAGRFIRIQLPSTAPIFFHLDEAIVPKFGWHSNCSGFLP